MEFPSSLDGIVTALSLGVGFLGLLLWILLRKSSTKKSIPHSYPHFFPLWDLILILFKYAGDGQKYYRERRDVLGSDTYYVHLFPFFSKFVVLCHPDDQATVYAKEGRLGMEVLLPDSVHKLHGENNMQHMAGPKHQLQRKIFSSIISPRALGTIVPTVLQTFDKMWERLDSYHDTVSIQEELQTTKLRMMAQILFGLSFRTPKEEQDFQQHAVDFELQQKALFVSERTTTFKKGLAAAKRNEELLTTIFEGMIDKHQKAKMKNDMLDINSSMENIAATLVEEGLDQDEESLKLVKDNLVFLLEASHGTSVFVSTALLFLLNRPENTHILELVREEVTAVNHPVAFDSLNKDLPYLEGCIKESMRIVTLVGANLRRITKDSEVGLRDGYQLKGPCDVLFQYSMHYLDPNVFPLPNKMIPERWLDNGNKYQASEFAQKVFKPFAAGRHRCLGEKMAILNIKCAVYSFARNGNRRLDFDAAKIGIVSGGVFPEKKVQDGLPARVVSEKK